MAFVPACGSSRSVFDPPSDDPDAARVETLNDATVVDATSWPTDAGVSKDRPVVDASRDASFVRADVVRVDVVTARDVTVPDAESPPDDAASPCGASDLGSRLGNAIATGSTSGPSRFEGSCGGDVSGEAVFTWTAPTAGDYLFSTEGSDFDTVLYVRDGRCGTSELDCNDDSVGVQSEAFATLAAGQTVTLFVDGYDGETGAFTLSITAKPAP